MTGIQVWPNVDMSACKDRFLACLPSVSSSWARILFCSPSGLPRKEIYANDWRPESAATARRGCQPEEMRKALAQNACVEIRDRLLTLKLADPSVPPVRFEDIESPLWREAQYLGLKS